MIDLSGCSSLNTSILNLITPSLPSISAGQDVNVCDGEMVTLNAINPDNANIQWSDGKTDGDIFAPSIGTTTYTVTATLNGCISTDAINITSKPNPEVVAENNLTICQGEAILFNPTFTNLSDIT